MKILIVDDDKKICDITAKYLTHAGFNVTSAFDGTSAINNLENNKFSLIILDVMLGDTTGFELLEDLRNGTFYIDENSSDIDIPVIMLTALSQTQNVIKGLKTGADDYVAKPFEPLELVERVKAILKRLGRKIEDEIVIGSVKINLTTYCFYNNNIIFQLQRRERDLFILLCRNKDKVYTREELLNLVWGFDYEGSDRSVDICVQRLRTKLTEVHATIVVKTVWGVGYKLEVIK